MACTCKTDIEAKLLARFKEQAPDATGHDVELQGYALVLGAQLEHKGAMKFETVADFPLKKGGSKTKKLVSNMIFTFCPFCAVKY